MADNAVRGGASGNTSTTEVQLRLQVRAILLYAHLTWPAFAVRFYMATISLLNLCAVAYIWCCSSGS